MLKKILKGALKAFVAVSVIVGLIYAGFHLWEYATGSKYINYLKENSETVTLDESFSFRSLDQDIKDSKLILAGEIHGFEEPQKFDFDLFTHLHANHDVRHYYAEMDYVQSLMMNNYMKTGEESFLKSALRKWGVIQGRNNKDYNDKFRKFQQYYQEASADDKFSFVGIDKIQDLNLTLTYLNDLDTSHMVKITESVDLSSILRQIDSLDLTYSDSPDTLFTLANIRNNLQHLSDKTNREKVMFENFYNLYKENNPNKEKAYCFIGLYHVFQYKVNGQDPLASLIRSSDLGLADDILSMNFLMQDSHMVMPSGQLPSFMQDPGKYTKMPVSSDQMLFIYIYGIKDFKRMTDKHHKSLIKMNANDSPYAHSGRMNKTIQLLPVTEKFNFDEEGKDYVQYTVFVRNSDWAEPEQ